MAYLYVRFITKRNVSRMWLILALSFSLLGVFIIYLTNKHQGLKKKSLPKKWRTVGCVFWLLALLSWLQVYVLSAAFFIWLFIISIMLICTPLITLPLAINKKSKPTNKRNSA